MNHDPRSLIVLILAIALAVALIGTAIMPLRADTKRGRGGYCDHCDHRGVCEQERREMMGEIELKGCPCGRTPTDVDVDDSSGSKWHFVYGNCCAEWHIQFRTYYHERTTHKNKALAMEAWNDAPRYWEKPE